MTGSRFIVYAARAGAKSFFEGISDPTFFMTINKILDDGYYKQYEDIKHGEVFTFKGLRDFVVHPEGLDISDWVPFMKALQAQDEESLAKILYRRMVRIDKRLNPDTEPVAVLKPAALKGMAGFNPFGHNQHTTEEERKRDHNNASSRGTSSEYRIARLKRDAPDIADALARGEYPSIRAAAIAAGFVPAPPPSLQLKEPSPTAQKLLEKKGKEWCLQLLDELSALVSED